MNAQTIPLPPDFVRLAVSQCEQPTELAQQVLRDFVLRSAWEQNTAPQLERFPEDAISQK